MNKIAIMMRLNLNGEALNNEGTIGNVMQPREIRLSDDTIRQAISGEMLKHLHTRNLTLLADENELCDSCKIFSPMKNAKIKIKDGKLSPNGNRVSKCLVDDIEGFMNPDDKEKRISCTKFSWAIATEENEYQSVLHTRVDMSSIKPNNNDEEGNEKSKKSTTDQMLFHRPIRSNEYALTVQIDLDRIGFDDEKLIYAVDEETVKNRQKKCVQALRNMFIDMEGALCSTRLPHIMNIEGILVHKKDKNDVLVKYSALNDDYKEVNQRISTNSTVFNNIEEFVTVLNDLI